MAGRDLRSSGKGGLIGRRCEGARDGPVALRAPEPAEPTYADPAPPRLLLSPSEAARALGISRTKLYQLLASGAVASVRVGSLRRIRTEALEEFVQGLGPAEPPGPYGQR